ncbi:nucleotidyltransferase-like protein [Paenibacillus thermotolerans]|uniref:nucleotidyltransferase-like protein n=1 Tax=Paenibacillus thermotolerans TaxID=3027807 RepID=UPI002367F098|nr:MULTISPECIES: nucleotidyltransferase-like protein [unclassified Paenibacillus]
MRTFIESRYKHRKDVHGLVLVERPMQFSALIDGFDALVLVITDGDPRNGRTHYYSKDNHYIQERWYDRTSFEAKLAPGGDKDVQQWVMAGEICMDTNGFLAKGKSQLLTFTPMKREKRLLSEFSLFLRHFILSKNYLDGGDVLDALSHIVTAVHHWARLSIVEQGHTPELTVWKQVKRLNPGIFKLYEELTMSQESVEQRVRLAHLACDFSVMSKLEDCCSLLIRILKSRSEPWSAAELEMHPELSSIQGELHLVLKKLAGKSLVKEVLVPAGSDIDLLELRYSS